MSALTRAQGGGPATVLVVDDARVNRLLLTTNLTRHGHRILEACHGRQALEQLADHPEVDLIILDLIMPEMDGFAFLAERLAHPEIMDIPVIVNSSLDDFDSIARALDLEAYDYFTKPLAPNDLQVVLPLKIKNAVTTRRLLAEIKRQNETMRGELAMAARYQQFLLPKRARLSGAQVAYRFEPCSGVGGDYFDFVQLGSGLVALMVADVSGHGVASAMIASVVKALLPGYLETTRSPAKALLALNQDLLRLTPEDIFVTAFAALHDPAAARLTWALAGHPAPLLLSRAPRPLPLAMDSPFLGFFANDDPIINYEDHLAPIAGGDRLVLYTDGLTEAPDACGNQYGQARLTELLAAHRAASLPVMCEAVWRDLRCHAPGGFPDDVALIMVEF